MTGLNDADGKVIDVRTDPISLLKAPKAFAVLLSQYKDTRGESIAYIDDIKVTQ
jgi:hypothetical protein